MPSREDDPLRWEGDVDPTLDTGAAGDRPADRRGSPPWDAGPSAATEPSAARGPSAAGGASADGAAAAEPDDPSAAKGARGTEDGSATTPAPDAAAKSRRRTEDATSRAETGELRRDRAADSASSSKAATAARTGTAAEAAEAAPMGNAALIGLGVIGGVYLLYMIGWFLVGARVVADAGADVMTLASRFLAVLAPIAWFAAVWFTTMRSKTWVRFSWLLAGVILLVPWPFVSLGAAGVLL